MRMLKVLTALILICATIITIATVIPTAPSVEQNPFLVGEGKSPMLAAHRGGGDNNPENTMLAFRQAVNEYKVDIIESDLWLTKDGYLVYNHDGYIDRTSDANGDISYDEMKELISNEENRHYIADMTLKELKEYNFGYYFEDESGVRIYKNENDLASAGLQIATVEELFEEFYHSNPDLLFIVEIKNGGEQGYKACDILANVIESYPEYADNIVIGSFHGEIESYLKENYPNLMRGASIKGAAGFIGSQYIGISGFIPFGFTCLQIPMGYDLGVEIKLTSTRIIENAHKKGIAVQFWTINDEGDMRYLIELGCDCIMTDNPALLRQVLSEYK